MKKKGAATVRSEKPPTSTPKTNYRVLVSAGDPSGDLILSKIIEAIKASPDGENYEFVGLCGPASLAQGVKPIASVKDVAVVGIVEVLKNLKKIFGALEKLRSELSKVDSVICVDFPDFNLRLAGMALKANVPVDYVVAPQVWAWRSGRINQMSQVIRRLYPALPFEESLFADAGIDTKHLGHPLRDLLPPRARRAARSTLGFSDEDWVFCAMPGSRKSEISRSLPLVLHAWSELKKHKKKKLVPGYPPKWRVVVPLAPGWTKEGLEALLSKKNSRQLEEFLKSGEWILAENSHQALMASDFGWITSGTATLEAAYYQLPHVLFYRLSPMTAFLLKRLSSYFNRTERMAGLPNILLGHPVVPELLQSDLSPRRLAIETLEMLSNRSGMHRMKQELRFIPKKMGESGASQRIAADLLNLWAQADSKK